VSASVVVYDYGSGNVHSAVKALERRRSNRRCSPTTAHKALEADGLVVPGVGAYQSVMQAVDLESGGASVIDQRISGGRSVLGICVGLQIMFEGFRARC
jgi:glutamine amidotransferase